MKQAIPLNDPNLISLADKHQGMPELKVAKKITSFFEFWPSQLIYFPVVMQWLFNALRYQEK